MRTGQPTLCFKPEAEVFADSFESLHHLNFSFCSSILPTKILARASSTSLFLRYGLSDVQVANSSKRWFQNSPSNVQTIAYSAQLQCSHVNRCWAAAHSVDTRNFVHAIGSLQSHIIRYTRNSCEFRNATFSITYIFIIP